jgi:small subunit ribosomal protein S16
MPRRNDPAQNEHREPGYHRRNAQVDATIPEVGDQMVKIRLRRMGTKKRPYFRVVVADSRSPRDGRFIENIGQYQPMSDPSIIEIDEERALHWLGQGAQPSDPVRVLLEKAGIWERFRPGDRRRVREPKPPKEQAPPEPPTEEPPPPPAAEEAAPEPSEESAEETS